MVDIPIKLVPFIVPDRVFQSMPPRLRQEGFHSTIEFLLSELEPEVLSDLCDEFREGVFKVARKEDPKLQEGQDQDPKPVWEPSTLGRSPNETK